MQVYRRRVYLPRCMAPGSQKFNAPVPVVQWYCTISGTLPEISWDLIFRTVLPLCISEGWILFTSYCNLLQAPQLLTLANVCHTKISKMLRTSVILFVALAIISGTSATSDVIPSQKLSVDGEHAIERSEAKRKLRGHEIDTVNEERSAADLAAKLDDVLSTLKKVQNKTLTQTIQHLQATHLSWEKREAIQHLVTLSTGDRKKVLKLIVENAANAKNM